MISFLHPGFLYAAGVAAAAVVALHFLVSEQPRAGVLPTVRFFPDVEVRSTALTVRLSDLLLLLIRVLTLMLIGAAFAQPQLKPSRSAILRIVALDVSRDVKGGSDMSDSAAKYLAGRNFGSRIRFSCDGSVTGVGTEFGGDIPLERSVSESRITFVGVDCRTSRSVPNSGARGFARLGADLAAAR